ncbi:MAG: DUF2851 family protein [Bacteroidales bacterium]|nr:DUF2851 family protein [Bacteroidales bacterium]
MNEAFLQYVWQHRLLDSRLETTAGEEVIVERVGERNSNAGPDFENARLIIGGVQWAGNVEVHKKTSDWNHHRHSDDKGYNNVVLHVVYEHDCEIRTENGQEPPVVELRRFIPEVVWNNYEHLMNPPAEIKIACGDRLSGVPDFRLNCYKERLAVERLEQKSQMVRQMLEDSKGGWETTCYWLTAHYFGGKANSFPFELLAKATPLNLLARYKNNPLKIEALLMGQAGLLEEYFDDDYPRQLQTEYQALRKGYSLTPISGYLWKFFRLRPSSFPTVRISEFAALVAQSSSLFSKLLATKDASSLYDFFNVEAADYWADHYMFDKPTKASRKRAGKMLAESLIINAWVPLLFEYGVQHGRQDLKDTAVAILQQLPAERNSIVGMWDEAGLKAKTAADTQALLQLYENYCKGHRCLDCQIGFCLIKN